jgi:hypothetical protein
MNNKKKREANKHKEVSNHTHGIISKSTRANITATTTSVSHHEECGIRH